MSRSKRVGQRLDSRRLPRVDDRPSRVASRYRSASQRCRSSTEIRTCAHRRDAGSHSRSWAKREAWRKTGVFSKRTQVRVEPEHGRADARQLRNAFPGLGIAIVAFGAYVAFDKCVARSRSALPDHLRRLAHPTNVEELKRAAYEDQHRPSVLSVLTDARAQAKEAKAEGH